MAGGWKKLEHKSIGNKVFKKNLKFFIILIKFIIIMD